MCNSNNSWCMSNSFIQIIMRKSAVFVFILLLACADVFPQAPSGDFRYTVSPPYRVVDAESKYYFYQEDEIMMVKIRGRRVTIQKFNARSMKFLKIKVHEDMPKGYVMESLRKVGDHYYLFYSLWDRGNETEQLFHREIDFDAGSFVRPGKPLLKIKGRLTGFFSGGSIWGMGVTDKFGFNVSFDEAKLLIQYRRKPTIRDDSKNYDVIGFNMYDADLEELWSEEVKMPYTEAEMNNLDYSVDADGNAFILASVYNEASRTTSHIELLRIEHGTGDLEKTEIKVGTMFIKNIWLYEGPKEYMVCAGFYSKMKSSDGADGVFLSKVSKEGEVSDIAKYEIPLSVLQQYTSARSQKKSSKKDKNNAAEFDELELRDVIIADDGSIVMIGEQYFIRVHTTYSSDGKSRTYYTYHYNDMLITKINPDGELAWMKKLPKRQTGRKGRGGMGYKYVYDEKNDSHFLLFLDNLKNMELGLDKVPANHADGAGGFLTAYKINGDDGAVTKASIFNVKDVNGTSVYQFQTGRIFSTEPGEIMVEVYKKKKEDVMIRIKVSE